MWGCLQRGNRERGNSATPCLALLSGGGGAKGRLGWVAIKVDCILLPRRWGDREGEMVGEGVEDRGIKVDWG